MQENGFLQALKLFKCFAGSTGFILSTFGLTIELFDEVTGSKVADCEKCGYDFSNNFIVCIHNYQGHRKEKCVNCYHNFTGKFIVSIQEVWKM